MEKSKVNILVDLIQTEVTKYLLQTPHIYLRGSLDENKYGYPLDHGDSVLLTEDDDVHRGGPVNLRKKEHLNIEHIFRNSLFETRHEEMHAIEEYARLYQDGLEKKLGDDILYRIQKDRVLTMWGKFKEITKKSEITSFLTYTSIGILIGYFGGFFLSQKIHSDNYMLPFVGAIVGGVAAFAKEYSFEKKVQLYLTADMFEPGSKEYNQFIEKQLMNALDERNVSKRINAV